MSDFTPAQCAGVYSWIDFFRSHRKYTFEGYLIGRFYTSEGMPTQDLLQLEACYEKHKKEQPNRDEEERKKICQFEVQNGVKQVGCNSLDFVPRIAKFMTLNGSFLLSLQ